MSTAYTERRRKYILWGIVLGNITVTLAWIVILLVCRFCLPQYYELFGLWSFYGFAAQLLLNVFLGLVFVYHHFWQDRIGILEYRSERWHLRLALTFVLAGCLSAFVHFAGCSAVVLPGFSPVLDSDYKLEPTKHFDAETQEDHSRDH